MKPTNDRLDVATRVLSPKALKLILSQLPKTVQVRIIYEQTSRNGAYPLLQDLIDEYDLELKRCGNFHAKFLLRDDEAVLLGSSNLVMRGIGKAENINNLEANVVCEYESVVREVKSLFDTFWTERDEVLDLRKESRFISSVYGIPSKIAEHVEQAEELWMVVPLRFQEDRNFFSCVEFFKKLHDDMKITVVTGNKVPACHEFTLQCLKSLDNVDFKFIESPVQAKLYIFNWKQCVVSSLNIEKDDWTKSLETGMVIKSSLDDLQEKLNQMEERSLTWEEGMSPPSPPKETPYYIKEIDLSVKPEGKDWRKKFQRPPSQTVEEVQESNSIEVLGKSLAGSRHLEESKERREERISKLREKGVNKAIELMRQDINALKLSKCFKGFRKLGYGKELIEKVEEEIGFPQLAKKLEDASYGLSRLLNEFRRIDKQKSDEFIQAISLDELAKDFLDELWEPSRCLEEFAIINPKKARLLIQTVKQSLQNKQFEPYFAKKIDKEFNLERIKEFLEALSQVDASFTERILKYIDKNTLGEKLKAVKNPKVLSSYLQIIDQAEGTTPLLQFLIQNSELLAKCNTYPSTLEVARTIQKVKKIKPRLAKKVAKNIKKQKFWNKMIADSAKNMTLTVKKLVNADIGWKKSLATHLNEHFDEICEKMKKKEIKELVLCAWRLSDVDDLGQQVIKEFSVDQLWKKLHKELQKAKLGEVRISIEKVNQLSKEVANNLLNEIVQYLDQHIEKIKEEDTELLPQEVSRFLKKVKNLVEEEEILNKIERLIQELEEEEEEEKPPESEDREREHYKEAEKEEFEGEIQGKEVEEVGGKPEDILGPEEGEKAPEREEERKQVETETREEEKVKKEIILEKIRERNITHPMVKKVNTGGRREGKGFSLAELEEAGLSKEIRDLLRREHYVDPRRGSCHERNVKVLRNIGRQ